MGRVCRGSGDGCGPGVIVAGSFATSWKEAGMIAVFVTFDSDMLDEGVVRKVASG